MENQLAKAINLARRTGDRLIVFDYNQKNPFVVMSLDEYEKLVVGHSEVKGLTEDELLDKINRDIAIWKSEQSPNISQVSQESREKTISPFTSFDMRTMEKGPILDDYNKDFGADELSSTEAVLKKKSFWRIPEDRKEGAEEIIEEDRQYLETV